MAVGIVVGVVALVALHILPTGLSAMRNPVSQYGISRYSVGYRVQTIAYGVAGIGAGVGLSTLPGAAALVVICAVFAASRLAIGWFPMDSPGAPRSQAGNRHGLLALGAFLGATVAAGLMARVLHSDNLHSRYATASSILALLMALSLVAMVVDGRTQGGRFGLIERGFYVFMTAWLVLVAVMLLR